MEIGKGTVLLSTADRLAKVLKTTTDWLLHGKSAEGSAGTPSKAP